MRILDADLLDLSQSILSPGKSPWDRLISDGGQFYEGGKGRAWEITQAQWNEIQSGLAEESLASSKKPFAN